MNVELLDTHTQYQPHKQPYSAFGNGQSLLIEKQAFGISIVLNKKRYSFEWWNT